MSKEVVGRISHVDVMLRGDGPSLRFDFMGVGAGGIIVRVEGSALRELLFALSTESAVTAIKKLDGNYCICEGDKFVRLVNQEYVSSVSKLSEDDRLKVLKRADLSKL